MTIERTVHRYAAYYRGWCQAFGEHTADSNEQTELQWLSGDESVGLIVTPRLKRFFHRELLEKNLQESKIEIPHSREYFKINSQMFPLINREDQDGMEKLIELLHQSDDIHLYLTSHFTYPSGTRILTFSHKRPLGILYKEIVALAARVH